MPIANYIQMTIPMEAPCKYHNFFLGLIEPFFHPFKRLFSWYSKVFFQGIPKHFFHLPQSLAGSLERGCVKVKRRVLCSREAGGINSATLTPTTEISSQSPRSNALGTPSGEERNPFYARMKKPFGMV